MRKTLGIWYSETFEAAKSIILYDNNTVELTIKTHDKEEEDRIPIDLMCLFDLIIDAMKDQQLTPDSPFGLERRVIYAKLFDSITQAMTEYNVLIENHR